MAKIFVIAGTRNEATEWIKKDLQKRTMAGETTLSMSEYVYVDDVIRIKGYNNPRGVFIGTWRKRADIVGIVESLYVQTKFKNDNLDRIRLELTSIKPTPKLKKVNGGWINEQMAIDHAANQMAKAMDAEALATLMNGGNMTQRQSDYTVAYDKLVPTLIQAVQDLKKELDNVKQSTTP